MCNEVRAERNENDWQQSVDDSGRGRGRYGCRRCYRFCCKNMDLRLLYTPRQLQNTAKKNAIKLTTLSTIQVFIYFQQKTKDGEKPAVKAYFLVDAKMLSSTTFRYVFTIEQRKLLLQYQVNECFMCLSVHYFSNKSHLSWAHLTFTNLLGEM